MLSSVVEGLLWLVIFGVTFALIVAGLNSLKKKGNSDAKNSQKTNKPRLAVVSEVKPLAVVSNAKSPEKEKELVAEPEVSKPPPVKKKKPLTEREKPMYPRLVTAFPNHVVLTQVAFSAIITHERQDWATDRATRAKFNRMVVDFVICTNDFDVIAVIELDDSTHDGNEDRDAARDAMLIAAGYKVFRYRQIPEVGKLREDITPDEAAFDEAASLVNIETA